MVNRLRRDGEAEHDTTAAAVIARPGRRLIVTMLLTAAALDLARCGIVLTAAQHLAATAGLASAGLATAALTAQTARGCQVRRRWAGWVALLIGIVSAPQAAAYGFHSPYIVPDTATAALGILLTVTILATADPGGPPGHAAGNPLGAGWPPGICALSAGSTSSASPADRGQEAAPRAGSRGSFVSFGRWGWGDQN
jgi:hypothetical protein